jgi:hypothetical protein
LVQRNIKKKQKKVAKEEKRCCIFAPANGKTGISLED